MPYLSTLKTLTFGTGSTCIPCDLPDSPPVVQDWTPGNAYLGGFAERPDRPASKYFYLPGVVFDFTGQNADATAVELGPIFQAAGLLEVATSKAGYSLGDPHFTSGDVSAGDCVPIATVKYNRNGQLWQGSKCVTDLVLSFVAGEIPTVTADFTGQLAAADWPTADTIGTVTATASAAAPWQGATITGGTLLAGAMIRNLIVSIGNRVKVRKDPTGPWGYGPPCLSAPRKTRSRALIEVPILAALSSAEYKAATGTQVSLGWKYSAGTGTNKVATFTMTGYLQAWPDMPDEDGLAMYSLDIGQNPTSGSLSWLYGAT